MGRIALAAAVLAAVIVPSAAAARTPPTWSAKGAITRLNRHSITVHGKTCRIAPDSPSIRVEIVGSAVRIVCDGGILFEIDLLHPLRSLPGSQSSSSSSSSSSSVSSTAVAGDFTITAIGGGSITVKGSGSFELTCTTGSGSPDTSTLAVGAHVSSMTCTNGVLTSLVRT